MKRKVEIVIDMAMALLLPMLMAYSLIGERFHEVVGTTMLALFIAHHWMKRKWYTALPKGKYSARRVFHAAVGVLLLLFIILQPVSGILLSKHLYTFLPVLPILSIAREIHLFLAYWGFVLMSIHAGSHLITPIAKLKRRKKGTWVLGVGIVMIISVYGTYAFVKRGFYEYMFLKTAFVFFDFSESMVFFLLDYLAVMILCAFCGMMITTGLGAVARNKRFTRKTPHS